MSSLSSNLSHLKKKFKHIINTSIMLCCGCKKESGSVSKKIIGEGNNHRMAFAAHPQYSHYNAIRDHGFQKSIPYFWSNYHYDGDYTDSSRIPEVVLQNDFRKVSGITSEVFRQIEAVEKDYDPVTAANFEAVEKKGEMLIRLLDPRTLGRAGAEAGRKYLCSEIDDSHSVQFIEIIKRPGQTLGLYIREGNGFRVSDGVFISRIALESPVYNSGLLKVGDEILAANFVDVRNMSLDDVVIIMSIPRRLVLTIRSKNSRFGGHSSNLMSDRNRYNEDYRSPPVVVLKKEFDVENYENDELSEGKNSENEALSQSRLKNLNSETSRVPIYSGDSEFYQQYADSYYSKPLIKMPSATGDDSLTRHVKRVDDKSKAYSNQSLNLSRTRFLDSLVSSQKVHPINYFNGRSNTLHTTRYPHNRFLYERMSLPRSKFSKGYDTSSLRSRPRLLRAESDNRIHSSSVYFNDSYLRQNKRFAFENFAPLDHQNFGNFRSSLSTQGISSNLEKRLINDGSVSDTEVDGLSRSFQIRQKNLKKYPALRALTYRDSSHLRSTSLPRARGSALSNNQYLNSLKKFSKDQSIRFEKRSAYNSLYDDDSDGAASAPELPESRHRRLDHKYIPGYSSTEYRQWLSRAPSTSAIYDAIKQTPQSSTLNSTLSLSLLAAQKSKKYFEKLKMDPQQKFFLANRSANINHPSHLPSYLLKSDLYDDSRSPFTSSSLRNNKSPLLTSSLKPDYFRTIPNPTSVKASENEKSNLITLNPCEFFKYRYERPLVSNISAINESSDESEKQNKEGFSGILWIHLLAGRNLRIGNSLASRRDLYCVLECNRIHRARTVIRSGESSFDWNEIFEIDIYQIKKLSFLLYSWDPQIRHKLCYKGMINLISLSLAETPVHNLALKMEPKGTLYIKLRYKDIRLSFQRTALSPTSASPKAIFGLSLETLVNRENSGLNIPLIVKRCVEEVEARGLDLVNIYRLCGSAVRKKVLREAFEKNAWLVDLTAEHVPDINVITSLLKDYLCELPEPLFTKALFGMMEDCLSVCLPDNSSGNAKLVYSILECLPSVNRSTVMYLMDHFKLVVDHSNRNKMSAQALAICFGPLFTCHSESESLENIIKVFKFLLETWPVLKGSTSTGGNIQLNSENNSQLNEPIYSSEKANLLYSSLNTTSAEKSSIDISSKYSSLKSPKTFQLTGTSTLSSKTVPVSVALSSSLENTLNDTTYTSIPTTTTITTTSINISSNDDTGNVTSTYTNFISIVSNTTPTITITTNTTTNTITNTTTNTTTLTTTNTTNSFDYFNKKSNDSTIYSNQHYSSSLHVPKKLEYSRPTPLNHLTSSSAFSSTNREEKEKSEVLSQTFPSNKSRQNYSKVSWVLDISEDELNSASEKFE